MGKIKEKRRKKKRPHTEKQKEKRNKRKSYLRIWWLLWSHQKTWTPGALFPSRLRDSLRRAAKHEKFFFNDTKHRSFAYTHPKTICESNRIYFFFQIKGRLHFNFALFLTECRLIFLFFKKRCSFLKHFYFSRWRHPLHSNNRLGPPPTLYMQTLIFFFFPSSSSSLPMKCWRGGGWKKNIFFYDSTRFLPRNFLWTNIFSRSHKKKKNA